MSENKASKDAIIKTSTQTPAKVVNISDHKCAYIECKKKPDRASFCNEHFDWFKAGLITKNGQKSPDFERKFYNYNKKSA